MSDAKLPTNSQDKLLRRISAFVFVSLGFTGVAVISSWVSYRGFQEVVTAQFRLSQLSQKIIYFDEVLTMSARMGAFTADPAWEKRYREFDPQLVSALEEAQKLAPAFFRKQIATTESANNRLVALEQRAFALTKQGNRQGAIALLFGKEYADLKQTYNQSITATLQATEQTIQDNLNGAITQTLVALVLSAIAFPVLLGSWLATLRLVKAYLQERQQIQAEIDQRQKDLEALNCQLQEKTKQLEIEEANARRKQELLQERALELLLEVDPVSKGDLTVRATVTSDEVGTLADSYNAIIRSLRQIVSQVQTAAQSVSATAVHSSQAVQAVVSDAERQTAFISSALSQVEEMLQSIQGVALRAKQAEETVQLASQVVEAGDQSADRALAGITALKSTVTDTARKVERLGSSSEKITKVVKVIRNFAAQTNLLALNASIEAARAGEEGESFAVVAEKVRALAQQSAAATSEIEATVEEIQNQIQEVILAMSTGAQQAEAGTKLVEEVRQTLTEITQASSQTNKLVQEIAQAASQQTETSQVVSETMHTVAETTQMTAERSQSVAESIAQLLELAQALQTSISQFKLA
jgi:methyl-accepting chemotaxis protein